MMRVVFIFLSNFSSLAGGVWNSIGVFFIVVVFPEQKYESRRERGPVGWASTKWGGMGRGGKERGPPGEERLGWGGVPKDEGVAVLIDKQTGHKVRIYGRH